MFDYLQCVIKLPFQLKQHVISRFTAFTTMLTTLRAITMTQKSSDETLTSIDVFSIIACSFGPDNMQEIFYLIVDYLV
jgi:hypothetical protein